MNSIYRQNLVFAKTREKGIAFLEYLVGEMKYKDIKHVRKSKQEMEVELTDGTIYQVVSASDNSRGYRCQKAYVQRSIDYEILDNIIYPCLIISDLPKEERIEFFE
jgi:hypothetical protein